MLVEAAAPSQGFSLLNLAILIVIVALLWPLFRWIRKVAAKHRARRYAGEEDPGYTEENDPDLRRDHS